VATQLKARISRIQTFSSLKHRNYRLLWSSTYFSTAGDWIQQVTMGWLVYNLTGSPFLVGATAAARGIPMFLIGPVSGVLSDRMDRRKLLLWNQLFLAVSALALAGLVASGRVQAWHLMVFAFLNGAGYSINTPLRQALVSDTVPRKDLPNAIALISLALNLNRALGPAVGGLLIAFFGAATNFFIQAACYVGVALMVFPMRVESHAHLERKLASPLADMREGIRYVAGERLVLGLILFVFIPSLFLLPFTTGLMPVFAAEALREGPEGLGFLLGSVGGGALVGTLIVASIGYRSAMVQLGFGLLSALGMIVASRSHSLALAMPFFAGMGLGQTAFYAMNNTLVQSITPDNIRGRVLGIYFLNIGLIPMGALLAGAMASFLGSPLTMLIGGCTTIALLLLAEAKFKIARQGARARQEVIAARQLSKKDASS